jgi:hypothetical protein
MKITTNCIIKGMPEKVYHSDPTPEKADGFKRYTSLSSTVAKTMAEQTELQAFAEISRFNLDKKPKASSDAVDLGSIMHDKVLLVGQRERLYEIVPFDDFKKHDARRIRDDLISRDIIPLADNEKTEELLKSLSVMDQRLREQLAQNKDFPNVMEKGMGEQSGFYFDEKLGIWKRARFDWLDDTYPDIVWDYKTTSKSVQDWIKQDLWKDRYIQCPHYMDVLSGISGKPCKFAFVVQQTVEPYLAHIVVIDEGYMDLVRNRYDYAQKLFVNCLKTDIWHGAPPYTIHSCPPPWVTNRWEEDELSQEAIQRRTKEEQRQSTPHDKTTYLNAG